MKPNPTAEVNPSEASLAELAQSDVAGPIAMLNLLRYDGGGGRIAYGRYAQVAAGSIAAVGGSLMYLGQVTESDWDTVAIVYYPSPQAYLAMQRDQRYLDAIPDRTAGLQARLLYPFQLPHITDSDADNLALGATSETVATRLVRRSSPPAGFGDADNPRATNTTIALRLRSVGSGLVTDGRWDELELVRYPSTESAVGDPWLGGASDPSVAECAVVLSQPAAPV